VRRAQPALTIEEIHKYTLRAATAYDPRSYSVLTPQPQIVPERRSFLYQVSALIQDRLSAQACGDI